MTRFSILALAAVLAPISVCVAQQEEMPWRSIIDIQIEAFRTGDGAGALEMAGEAFRMRFKDPEAFLAAIVALGYGPLVTSRSHSFGDFRTLDDDRVLQVVRLVGADQSLYEAVYQLAPEPKLGWRVQGVVLRRLEGMAI